MSLSKKGRWEKIEERCPRDRLSRKSPPSPRARSISTVTLPIYPAPPVTRIILVSYLFDTGSRHRLYHVLLNFKCPKAVLPGEEPAKIYGWWPVSSAYLSAKCSMALPASRSPSTATVPPLPPPVILAP